ncbi:uncharacterized protein LOC143433007 [Xylocopa sonorina]|uniref:uncharacterized protein LOC143433007 n=1 Tax=Xylocopa sonorina TaxID=1818115 RepID=UPI00403AFDEB
MLGLIFRGVFLIGVLTWYSASVWKLIDGYFRDQFKSYLAEEYRKNPRMKSDTEGNTVDKIGRVPTTPSPETTLEPLRELFEAERAATCAVEVVGNVMAEVHEEQRVTGGTSENEAAGESIDKNAFLGTAAESGLESSESSEDGQDSRPSVNQDDRDLERQGDNDRHRSAYALSKNSRKRINYRRKSVPTDRSRENGLSNKQNVRVTRLTDRDHKSRSHASDDDDFWEFEEEADGKEPVEGILVSKLPFKPRTDIGDLERVTADEYCPLSLEDEASCDEVFKWP